ncbi:glycosyltransferase family 25 protein [Photobacterium salinisoli]|uniref:glycosyltransferase family 25 protein n=1 Tax=Photobacterium salinisoli TaxID=1616783 RepID=UPI0030843E0B
MTIPTFVVSLARSSHRREHMQTLMDQAGISFQFFDAVDGIDSEHFLHSEKATPALTFKRKGYQLVPAEVACFASHYALWEKCLELDTPILILEDNVNVLADVHSVLADIQPYIEQYHYIKLSAHQPNTFKALFAVSDTHSIGVYRKGTCGTSAYIITPVAAKSFLENAQRFIEPVDDYMEKPWRHGIQAYHVYPSVFERSQTATTIGSTRKQKQSVGFSHKLYIEGFRTYETIMRKLKSIK